MSNSRTLQRKSLADKARRANPENRPVKRGTDKRSIRDMSDFPAFWFGLPLPMTMREYGYRVSLHVTKGFRVEPLS